MASLIQKLNTRTRPGPLSQDFQENPATCHPDKPLYAKGLCRSCYEKQLRKINPDFAKRQREISRQWVATHTEQKRKIDQEYRAKQDPEWQWARSLWFSHHITPEQYRDILHQQNGQCAICGRKPGRIRLAVDHCHTTGYIRGLLCFRCNFGLSWFQDNSMWLETASKHVTKRLHLKGTHDKISID